MAHKTFLSLGECMIELSQANADSWRMGIAGDTLNTAWYARAFLGADDWNVAYFTRLGRDPYSQRIADFLDAAGIDTQWIARDDARQPGLYLIETKDGERSFTYWRSQSAARLLADDEHLLGQALERSALAYVSGITLAILAPDRRAALLDALKARRAAGGAIIFDPNIRPKLWEDEATTRDALMAAARVSDIALPSFEDEQALFGDETPAACAARYRDAGCREVVVKNGGDAMIIVTDSETVALDGLAKVKPVDTTGAGDSFNGAYLAARQQGADCRAAGLFAHKVASEVVMHRGALMAMEDLKALGI